MTAPIVTIITPTKNRLNLLRETIASVQAQTFSNWEHLIIDDGSDDGSQEMVEQISAIDPRVRLIRRQGDLAGANVCRNLGIKESRSEFCIFLDSDDLLAHSCLKQRVEMMNRNLDVDFVVFLAGFFVEKPGDIRDQLPTEIFGDDLLSFLTFDFPWQTTAPIWRQTALTKLGGFDEALLSWQDVDLHIRAICAGIRYLKVPELDHYVRWQNDPDKVSVQQRRSPAHLLAAADLLSKLELVVRSGPGMDWRRQRSLAGLYFLIAELWLNAGSLNTALGFWGRSQSRGLSNKRLHASGCLLLLLLASPLPRSLSARIIHKWKGFARFRINPSLLG
jgi:glycosyltransferase involved in cell wall biosynthesis